MLDIAPPNFKIVIALFAASNKPILLVKKIKENNQ